MRCKLQKTGLTLYYILKGKTDVFEMYKADEMTLF